ncbi:MarP family serine protease [Microbacterium sp. KUDC0406]|uniref:MarP family serine protease n=1 Tax=Microbacterium sp. KUDC0406 TaxID=2909588 RepID=UPI001F44674D|nr:MarP family serine protease [Microbacterium sp. KUDC0406]UJP10561.1 MarP family serine protease [Microbacterium sp. KUDC0406]
MTVVDVIVVVLLIVALVSGIRAGLFAVLGMLCGLVAGGLAAPWALPWVSGLTASSDWHGLSVVGSAILLLGIGAGVGAAIGALIRHGADRLRLRGIERLLGGVLAVVSAALVLTLTGAGIAAAGIPVVSASVASSVVLRTIEQSTPPPVAEAMARLHSAVLGDTTLPTIDGLLDESDLAIAPDPGEIDTDDPALAAAAESVARVSGIAAACGITSSGSGFVVADDLIVTNAHVVAGVDAPIVELPGEPARDGRVVYFDPVDDLAVVAADVNADPLPLADALGAGDGGVVQGYPHGGPFRTVPAGVIRAGSMLVDDIHGANAAERSVYTLRADVQPGNSGGPLLTQDGAVAGVVFARDEVQPQVGYAMTNAELLPVLAQLDRATRPVSTGACRA